MNQDSYLVNSLPARTLASCGLFREADDLAHSPRVFTNIAPPGRVGQSRAGCLPRWDALMILVTGGAGFIGSNVFANLNEAGRSDIAVNDWLGSDGKWRNLQKRQLADMVAPADLFRWLDGRKLDA